MMSLRISSLPQETRPLNKLVFVFIALALIGLVDAGYLTIEHYRGVIPTCTLNGCETVLTSRYAAIGPVPIAAIGTLYYLVLLLAGIGYLSLRRPVLIALGAAIAGMGFAVSLGLVYIQFFILKSLCAFCLLSALTTTLLFVASAFIIQNIPNELGFAKIHWVYNHFARKK